MRDSFCFGRRCGTTRRHRAKCISVRRQRRRAALFTGCAGITRRNWRFRGCGKINLREWRGDSESRAQLGLTSNSTVSMRHNRTRVRNRDFHSHSWASAPFWKYPRALNSHQTNALRQIECGRWPAYRPSAAILGRTELPVSWQQQPQNCLATRKRCRRAS